MANDQNEYDTLQKIITERLQIKVCKDCTNLFISSSASRAKKISEDPTYCSICLGILDDGFVSSVIDHVRTSFEAYGGIDVNVISKDAPTVAIPVHTAIRAYCCLEFIRKSNIEGVNVCKSSASELYTKIKDLMRHKLRRRLHDQCKSQTYDTFNDLESSVKNILEREESGFMNCHVIIGAPSGTDLPTKIMHIPTLTTKRDRTRFRGNDPTEKQGGDPRVNLHKRTLDEFNRKLQETADDRAMDSLKASILERSVIFNALESASKKTGKNSDFALWIESLPNECSFGLKCSIHVASWRNPFYLKGRYTKSRRDCSQTPFFVSAEKGNTNSGLPNEMKRLGITSVEEEICPVVSTIACSGISTQNNLVAKENKGSNIVYGMAKFHASGR